MLQLYTPIDDDGKLEMPIITVNKACHKQVHCSLGKDGKLKTPDEDHFAKLQFKNKNYALVEFDETIPLGCFLDLEGVSHCFYTGEIIDGVAEVNQNTVDLKAAEVLEKVKREQRYIWMGLVHDNLDVSNQKDWAIVEQKVAFSKMPTDEEFESYDSTFKFV